MTAKKTRRLSDKLHDFVRNYNASFHRSIGTSPNSVTPENANEVWERMYKGYIKEKNKPVHSVREPYIHLQFGL